MDKFKNLEPSYTRNLLDDGCEAYLWRNLFSDQESQNFFESLLAKTEWQQDEIKIYGRLLKVPRLSALYADVGKNYSYSKIVLHPKPWFPELLEIKERIEALTGLEFNSVLLNLYRNGDDSMGWHRDNEPELGINPAIGSVSFGVTRVFKLRPYIAKKPVRNIELESGSFLLMKGETQHRYEHSIPKTSLTIAKRINLTFRKIL